MQPTRRRLLQLVGLATMPGIWRPLWATPNTVRQSDPFRLGVASGLGSGSTIVLWTRIAPEIEHQLDSVSRLALSDYLDARETIEAQQPGPMTVHWELASDSAFKTIVRRGTAQALPELAHSVHVEISDLPGGRPYWYRFMVGHAVSPTGMTRTAHGLQQGLDRCRLALASCQHYEHGHFGAYRSMLKDAPDFVLFAGDYIYEAGPQRKRFRSHPLPAARTLTDYRLRHALYKLDPDLQRMHAACPWLVTWDDHEVSNDYARDTGTDLRVDGAARRAAAYQAYYEHMPLPASALAAQFSDLRLYRHVDLGKLARIMLLDGRQFRARQACPEPGRGGGANVDDEACPSRQDPARSLLGPQQEAWLSQRLADTAARWNLIAQQTLMAQVNRAPPPQRRFWTDGWDGYPAARTRLLETMQQHRTPNPVVLGGDVHSNWATELRPNFDRPGPAVATEFCGTSLTSVSHWTPDQTEGMVADNPHVRFAEAQHRGYMLLDLSPAQLQVNLRVADDVRLTEPKISSLRRFTVEDGKAAVREG